MGVELLLEGNYDTLEISISLLPNVISHLSRKRERERKKVTRNIFSIGGDKQKFGKLVLTEFTIERSTVSTFNLRFTETILITIVHTTFIN